MKAEQLVEHLVAKEGARVLEKTLFLENTEVDGLGDDVNELFVGKVFEFLQRGHVLRFGALLIRRPASDDLAKRPKDVLPNRCETFEFRGQ